MYQYYLVTLTKTNKKTYVSYEYLQSIIKGLDKQSFNVIDYCLEAHGKYKQLHAHLLVRTNKHFRYKKHIRDVQGFIMHYKLVTTDHKRIHDYIHKHCNHHNEEQLQHTYYTNYYRYHYGF